MRLIVLSTGIPHEHFRPRLSASLMTLWRYLSELSDAGVEIMHLIMLDRKNDEPDLLDAYRRDLADPKRIAVYVWRADSLLHSRPSLVFPPRARLLPREFQDAITAFQPDAIFCLDAYSAAGLGEFHPAPIFVQVHDPKFQTLWHHALYLLREQPGKIVQVLTDVWQSMLWRGYYKRALRRAERVVTVALSSIPPLRRMGIHAELFPMLWLDPTEGHALAPVALPARPTFLFQGNLAGLGSRAALHFLLRRAYPHIRRQWDEGGFRILLCGTRVLPAWVSEAIKAMPEIEFLGFVDDIVATMRGCHAVIAPIDVPIGNRTRILTAMAAGVPVIAHRSIASANPHLVDGETCLLASNPREFAEKMAQAARRGAAIDHVIATARKRFDQEFHPKAAAKALLEGLRGLAKRA